MTTRHIVTFSMAHIRALLIIDAHNPLSSLRQSMSPQEIGRVYALRKALGRIAVAVAGAGGAGEPVTVTFTSAQVDALAWLTGQYRWRHSRAARGVAPWIQQALRDAFDVLVDAQRCA